MQFNNLPIKVCCVIAACLMFTSSVYAQKSSDITEGVKAPATVKVDGKLTEWGTTLPAYNKSNALHYILANDANNLYLAINSTDQNTINKILGGGLTLTINKEGKKKEKDATAITYPMVSGGGGRGFRMGGGRSRNGETVDTAALVTSRKQTVAGMKEFSVTGVKEITDTLVSIYNTYGIKTAITFDAKGNLSYELAVPLKLLELNAGQPTELAYNIKLNGLERGGGGRREGGNRQGGGNGGGFGGGNGGGISISGGEGGIMDLMMPTDFWGKYKLAKP